MDNTRNLMDFGRRELHLAGNLLRLFRSDKDHTLRLGDTVTPELNPDSGLVFLIDEDFNIAMVKDDHLEDWIVCPECGKEGFVSDLSKEKLPPCCENHYKTEFSQE